MPLTIEKGDLITLYGSDQWKVTDLGKGCFWAKPFNFEPPRECRETHLRCMEDGTVYSGQTKYFSEKWTLWTSVREIA